MTQRSPAQVTPALPSPLITLHQGLGPRKSPHPQKRKVPPRVLSPFGRGMLPRPLQPLGLPRFPGPPAASSTPSPYAPRRKALTLPTPAAGSSPRISHPAPQLRAPWGCDSSSEAEGGPAAPGAGPQPQRRDGGGPLREEAWGNPHPMSPGAAARCFHTSSARLHRSPCGVPAGVPSCQHRSPGRGPRPQPTQRGQGVQDQRSEVWGERFPTQPKRPGSGRGLIPAAVKKRGFF